MLNGGITSKVIIVVIVLNGKVIVYRLTPQCTTITPSIECMVIHMNMYNDSNVYPLVRGGTLTTCMGIFPSLLVVFITLVCLIAAKIMT